MAFTRATAVTGYTVGMVSAAGAAVTSGTVSVYIAKDGGTQNPVAYVGGGGAGTATHLGNGQWKVNLTATEMTADLVGLVFTHAAAVPVQVALSTATADVNVVQLSGDAAAAVADIAAKTTNLPASPAAVGSAMTLTSGERTSVATAVWDFVLTTGHVIVGSPALWMRSLYCALFRKSTLVKATGVETVYDLDGLTPLETFDNLDAVGVVTREPD